MRSLSSAELGPRARASLVLFNMNAFKTALTDSMQMSCSLSG